MPWYYAIPVSVAIQAVATPFEALAAARYDVFFTIPREGTVKFVTTGSYDGSFKDVILSWNNHYLNKPGTTWYNSKIPPWEVLEVGVPYTKGKPGTPSFVSVETRTEMPVMERNNFSQWLYNKGVVYYGLWPFEHIHRYRFKWTEEKISRETGVRKPLTRDEMTDIMFVETFVYYVTLEGAEDRGGQPLDLDYLLSVRVNNPRKARFDVTDWLARLTADSNNAAKVWVAQRTFSEVTKEIGANPDESTFVQALKELNFNLPTEHETKGAPEVIGVTVVASSLQQVQISGSNRDELIKASTKVVVAEREGDAKVIAAQKEGEAEVALAELQKQAAILRGQGEAGRYETILGALTKKRYGNAGMRLRQMEAMQAAGPGDKTVIWTPSLSGEGDSLPESLRKLGVPPEAFTQAAQWFSKRPPPSAND